jgi:chemotaxis protein methyltransferase WspC
MNPANSSVAEQLLAERIGLDPSSVGDRLIARGVLARMAALGVRSKLEYERILIEQGDEVQALIEEVVVAESWFFRDERPFEILARFAIEGWIGEPTRPPLTVLSLPCASGEEPYSIAITLLEAGLSAERFRVEAVDISARSIARAIAGVYGSNAFRGTGSSRRASHFLERNGAFTLDQAVRSTVRFRLGNLLDPTLFADRPPFDVVFCRNVLIYLDDDAKGRGFASLARLVAEGGLLFLGHADRLEVLEGTPFEPIEEKGSFGFRKRRPSAALPPDSSRRVGLALPITPTAETRPASKKGTGTSRVHSEPVPFFEAPPPQASAKGTGTSRVQPKAVPLSEADASSLLDRASSLADSGRYDEASTLIAQAIAAGGASARAYFLLGMIAQASDVREAAEGHYLKAIYLDAQHDEALLALALLARRKGDVAAEAGYRRRAERVLARKVVP